MNLKKQDLKVIGVILLISLICSINPLFADSPITEGAYYPATQMEEATFRVFNDSSTYYAKNGITGAIDYSGSNASQVIEQVLASCTNPNIWEKISFTGAFNIPNSITIQGKEKLILEGGVFTQTGTYESMWEVSSYALPACSNLILRDLHIIGNPAYGSGSDEGNGLRLGNVKGALLDNLRIENTYGRCLSVLATYEGMGNATYLPEHVIIMGGNFTKSAGATNYATVTIGGRHNKIIGSFIDAQNNTGVGTGTCLNLYDNTYRRSYDLSAIGVTTVNAGNHGIHVMVDNTTVSDCTVLDALQGAIEIEPSLEMSVQAGYMLPVMDVVVSNCYVANSLRPLRIQNAQNVRVQGCTFTNNTVGVSIRNQPAGSYTLQNIAMKGIALTNTYVLDNGGTEGIAISNTNSKGNVTYLDVEFHNVQVDSASHTKSVTTGGDQIIYFRWFGGYVSHEFNEANSNASSTFTIRDVRGYQTQNTGTTSTVTNGDWQVHNLTDTPDVVILTPDANCIVWCNARNATHFQFGVSAGTPDIDWYVEYKP